jgi:hypothetical protein
VCRGSSREILQEEGLKGKIRLLLKKGHWELAEIAPPASIFSVKLIENFA